MFYLHLSLQAWGTDDFTDTFKKEISVLNAYDLPLQQGLSSSSHATCDNLSASILRTDSDESYIYVKAGLFYTGIIAGCSCADDPTPVNENSEYCEAMFTISRNTAETTVTLLS